MDCTGTEFGIERDGDAVRLMVGCPGCKGITTQQLTPEYVRKFANTLLAAADSIPLAEWGGRTPTTKGQG